METFPEIELPLYDCLTGSANFAAVKPARYRALAEVWRVLVGDEAACPLLCDEDCIAHVAHVYLGADR